MPDLEKNQILIYPQKLCYAGYEISANFSLFLNTNLDRNKTISILEAHSWISKLSMRKNYVSLTLIKSKVK